MENIYVTKDYELFRFGEWNRDIKAKNLNKIDKSVKEHGWEKHPILVNENMEVIDGQHRLVYAKKHDLPIYYFIVDGLTAKDCVEMNNVRSPWTLEDYIKFYVAQGNENYIRLQTIINTYDFAPTSTLVALIRGYAQSSGHTSNMVRKGEFKITPKEMKDISAKLDYLQELKSYIQSIKGRSTSLNCAIAFCYDQPEIDNARLKKQIKNLISIIIPPIDMEMAIVEVERIYNRNLKRSEYVDIRSKYKKFAREQIAKTRQNLTSFKGK